MKTVAVEKNAEIELLEAVAWYETRQEGVGMRFLSAVDAVLESLPRRKLKPLRGHPGVLRADVGRPWPYRLVCVERGEAIYVLAFAHNRRAPGYWRERLTGLETNTD